MSRRTLSWRFANTSAISFNEGGTGFGTRGDISGNGGERGEGEPLTFLTASTKPQAVRCSSAFF
jgi:hypothetical protein